MGSVRVAVNGFGRIGRTFLRAAWARPDLVEVVAVNDTNDPAMLAYLLEHDTVQGPLGVQVEVEAGGGLLCVGASRLALFHDRDPAALPWGDLGID